jgi:hypothetical protein
MMPLGLLLDAAVVALVLLAVGLSLVGRERGRRQRLRAERERRTERLIWQRLDWVASPGPASSAPISPEPASPEPIRLASVGPAPTAARWTAEPAAQGATWAAPTVYSPRRRLWRDTSLVLLVGVLGVLAVSLVAQPNPAPEGGVLAATSAPAKAAPAASLPAGSAPAASHRVAAGSPAPTARPTRTVAPAGQRRSPSVVGPGATSVPTPVPPIATPRAVPEPTAVPKPRRTPAPTASSTPVVITPPPAPTPVPSPASTSGPTPSS